MKRLSWIASFALVTLGAVGCRTCPEAAKNGLYGQQIIIETNAAAMVKESSRELARWLGQMTGAEFTVTNPVPGNLTGAIYVLSTNSPLVASADLARLKGQGLEAFVIRGDSSQLQIIANDGRGLSHGVYFYLEQLGMRWLLSGSNWTIVPTRGHVTLAINRLVAPAFFARGYAGTGGFYSNLLGRQYTGSADRKKGISDFEIEATAWDRRLRFGGQSLGHAMGEAFISDKRITTVLEAHPEYLAKIDGKYTPLYIPAAHGGYVWNAATNRYVKAVPPGTGTHELNTIVKLNAGNPAAVDLYAQWILARLRDVRHAPGGYACQTISVEPSDGTGEGNNYEELKAQGVGDGSESDQEFFIANQCARLVRAEFPDVSVVMLAYAQRSDPPTFALEPNFIVQPAFAFRYGRKTAGLSTEDWLAAWKAKGCTMAVYDYWSIPDWEHDEPTFNYLELAKKLRNFYANNIKGVSAESTYSAGAMGLGLYVAAHLMWDINLDEHALIEEWYDKAFGPAKAPMKRMIERWAQSYRPLSAELGASYRDLEEAQRLAPGNPAVIARLDDYARYLHYLRLRTELLNTTDAAARNQKASSLAEYLFDIHESRMVHTTRDFDLLAFRGYPALKEEFYRHDSRTPGDPADGPGWARVHPLTHADVAALLADGLSAYPAPDFVSRIFTGKLVPVTPLSWTPPAGDPWGPSLPVISAMDVDLQVPAGLAAFPLRVSRAVDNTVAISDASGHNVYKHIVTTATTGTAEQKYDTWDELSIPLAPGHYTVHFNPKGGRASGHFRFQTWKGVPLTLRKFLVPKGTGSPKLYFYVPRGLQRIVIYFPLTSHAGGFETAVYAPDGTRATVENRDNGKLLVVPVPRGQDDQVWWLDRVVQPDEPFETVTVPQAFSLSPEGLMVPSDARPK